MKRIKRRCRELYLGFRVRIRILRLKFLFLKEPEDAKDPGQMLKEIKEALKLT